MRVVYGWDAIIRDRLTSPVQITAVVSNAASLNASLIWPVAIISITREVKFFAFVPGADILPIRCPSLRQWSLQSVGLSIPFDFVPSALLLSMFLGNSIVRIPGPPSFIVPAATSVGFSVVSASTSDLTTHSFSNYRDMQGKAMDRNLLAKRAAPSAAPPPHLPIQ